MTRSKCQDQLQGSRDLVTAKFVNMPFNKNSILNKNLHLLKGYTAQKLLNFFKKSV